MRRLVDGLIDMVERTLGPGVEIETKIPDTLPPILIDENQLELAIINLAVNANDAMHSGGRLTISADEATGEQNAALRAGRYVRLSIADTGEGMDAATLSHATEPFFTTKGVGKGTGLGLAMVRGLTEQSGGTVTIQSEVGKGTVVTMWIPVSYKAVAVEAAPVEVAAETAGPRRLKVLVVDDDVLVAMNTTAMLEDLGHEVVEAHSGRQALRGARRGERFRSRHHRSGDAADDRLAVRVGSAGEMAGPAGDPRHRLCRAAGRCRPVAAAAQQAVHAVRARTRGQAGNGRGAAVATQTGQKQNAAPDWDGVLSSGHDAYCRMMMLP